MEVDCTAGPWAIILYKTWGLHVIATTIAGKSERFFERRRLPGVFLSPTVGKLISEGAPPRRRGGAGGTHASPPSGVPGWEGGHKKHKPKGQSLCGIRESLKTQSSEML